MINRPWTRRLVPYLSVYLLVVSVGVPLQKVYCACLGQEYLGLFTPELQCRHATAEAEAEDHTHKPACCSLRQERRGCEQSFDADKNCGSAQVVLAQFDADFTTSTTAPVTEAPSFIPKLIPAFVFPYEFAAIDPTLDRPIRGPTPPWPPKGRDILVLHQLFLC